MFINIEKREYKIKNKKKSHIATKSAWMNMKAAQTQNN